MTTKKLVNPTEINIGRAIDILKNGGVVVLPTDTNYNVFTNIHSTEGIKRIFSMKKRNALSPLSLCFERTQAVSRYANVNETARDFIHQVWPASISFIMDKTKEVSDAITCGFSTVAIACHQHLVLSHIIKAVGEPIAGTSANLSGTGLVKDIDKVCAHLGTEIDLIINGGNLPSAGANTIVDFSFDPPVLARRGDFLTQDVIRFIPNLQTQYSEDAYKTLVRNRFFKTTTQETQI